MAAWHIRIGPLNHKEVTAIWPRITEADARGAACGRLWQLSLQARDVA